MRGAAKYGGPFSGAGVVPKSTPKIKDKNLEKISTAGMFVPKNWDGENTFSTSTSTDGDGNENSHSRLNYHNSDSISVITKKDHNRVRKEKREKKAFENLAHGNSNLNLISKNKNQHGSHQSNRGSDEVEVDDDGTFYTNNDTSSSSSSSSLKNLLFRAHSGGISENRTDSIDMRNNKGKLDERSHSLNSPFNKNGNNGNNGNGNENNSHSKSQKNDEKNSENAHGQRTSESGKNENSGFRNQNQNPEDVDDVVTMLTHIRK